MTHRLRAERVSWDAPRHVYFIQAGNRNAPIKIGIATDPRRRLEDMQTSNPNRLVLLGYTPLIPHARATEEFFHDVFRALWIRREWFRATPELLDAADDFCDRRNASFWQDHGVGVA